MGGRQGGAAWEGDMAGGHGIPLEHVTVRLYRVEHREVPASGECMHGR